ncbi:MAG: amino acid permease, partial [Candidatus Babeliaceae bacterium]
QPLVIDTAIIIFFGFLNILNIRIGSSIQKGFIVLKLIPILFVIVVALFLFMPTNYTSSALIWSGIPGTIPFVLFAFSGFEAVCSLSQSIDRPEKNGPRAIYLAFGIVLTLTVLYQTSFFGILGMQLAHLTSFRQTYPVLLNMLFVPASALYQFFSAITLLGIAASSLGASYGILYSNSWNLYTLAQSHHIPFFRFFGTLNRHRIPLMCVFIEVIAALGYLWLSQGNQVPLQQISACGSTIAYSLSAVVFCYLSFWVTQRYRLLSFLSLLSCSILLWALFQNGRQFGAQAYMLFSLILLAGTILFIIQRKTKLA